MLIKAPSPIFPKMLVFKANFSRVFQKTISASKSSETYQRRCIFSLKISDKLSLIVRLEYSWNREIYRSYTQRISIKMKLETWRQLSWPVVNAPSRRLTLRVLVFFIPDFISSSLPTG